MYIKFNFFILSRLSDFMTCSEHLIIFSEGSLSQLWNTWEKIKFGVYVNQTLKLQTMLRLNDFVVARKRFISSGLFISASKKFGR